MALSAFSQPWIHRSGPREKGLLATGAGPNAYKPMDSAFGGADAENARRLSNGQKAEQSTIAIP